ncbi:MAG TPA: polysaccharide deacetylase family protein [Pyrinomonadaceae bacterium]|nr:polysaccharide deacetylase family protein [Pyrinomonadaceae bacterium]
MWRIAHAPGRRIRTPGRVGARGEASGLGALKGIKRAALRSLKTAGAFRLVGGSNWRRRRLLILTYHGVSLDDEHLWRGALYVSPETFRSRMSALKRCGASVLPLGEAVQRLYANDLPERAVAITFDDGTYDFHARAHPVLAEFGFPVTLYLTTFYTEFNRPVFDPFCSYLLWKGRGASLDLKEVIGTGARVELSDDAARASALSALRGFAAERRLSAEEKDELLRSVARGAGVDYEELAARRVLHLVNPEEVRELAAAGVDIQLHTHRHRTPNVRELFRREIDDNRAVLQRLTGRDPSHFCYPSGVYERAFLPWLAEAGVRTATTCDTGYATRESEPLLLPRLLDVSSLSDLEFEGWLTGVSAALPLRREATTGVAAGGRYA